ncbi:flagellar basal body P-ring formation chaperone FlgA [Teichococcus aestuarii]|uniref:flagellar basal body P-ring formation chaperone FlgA n=1 Tax=Teichococcus aestuarii TaxID=568898 RepID=UPI003618CC24
MRRAAALAPALALLLLAAPLPARGQGVPQPRPLALVEGGTVTLGDLFEEAGPRAGQPLGPAPAPGRRFVVEASQLAVIARDYGLGWTPLAGDERVVVERPGRPLALEEVEAVLRAELATRGADPSLDIDLPGYQPPMVPAGGEAPRLALEAVEYDAAGQRFAATLVVLADGMATLRQRLAGRVLAMRGVVVATRPLRAGEVLSARDLRPQRLPAEKVRPGMAERVEAVAGQRLVRALRAGQPVPLADLAPPPALRKDAPVLLLHDAPGLSITAQGRALEDGAPGATITVLNLATGATVLAEVLGPDRARALGPLPAPTAAVPPRRAAWP